MKIVFVLTVSASLFYYSVCQGTRVFYVSTGSMEQAIPAKSLIVSNLIGGEKAEVDQIVVFNDRDNKRITAHRIESIQDNFFVTKGDANTYRDRYLVRPGDVVGKVVIVLPVISPAFFLAQATLLLLFLVSGVLIRKFLVFLT